MKGGARRKTRSSDLPPPLNPFHNEIVDQVNDEDAGVEDRPKLADGFYEIESIKKTRVRKGAKQYLIKWRGWPESANTWEPAESFTSCPDVLEAFESTSSGKRKRKSQDSVGPASQSKKKQQQPQPQQDSSAGIKDSKATENNVDGTTHNGTVKESNRLDDKLGEVKPTSPLNLENTTEFAIHIQEDPAETANADSKVDETDIIRASPRFGARRRKSCAVKRFKKELNSISIQDFAKKTTAASDGNANADDVVNGLDSEKVLDTPKHVSVITKIIKPVNYSVSVVNDIEEVFVSFLVLRSDGEEIIVDNKYLKENNPVLLIDYYEQHLRYTSPSE